MPGILSDIFSVFDEIGVWLIDLFNQMTALFWSPGSPDSPGNLTFLGVLAVVGLGFSVVFLIIGVIQRFLHFRG